MIFTRVPPLKVINGIGLPGHDDEGRVITAEFKDFYLVNVYQPNSQRGLTRLKYRTEEWDPAFLAFLKKLEKKGKPVVFCGDLNVAHTEIDLTNPKTNRRNAGFTDEERTNFSTLLAKGFVDTFRAFVERWAVPHLATTAEAPPWDVLEPGQTTLDQLTYDDIRAREVPMLCHLSGVARESCVFWEPVAGAAGLLYERLATAAEEEADPS